MNLELFMKAFFQIIFCEMALSQETDIPASSETENNMNRSMSVEVQGHGVS